MRVLVTLALVGTAEVARAQDEPELFRNRLLWADAMMARGASGGAVVNFEGLVPPCLAWGIGFGAGSTARTESGRVSIFGSQGQLQVIAPGFNSALYDWGSGAVLGPWNAQISAIGSNLIGLGLDVGATTLVSPGNFQPGGTVTVSLGYARSDGSIASASHTISVGGGKNRSFVGFVSRSAANVRFILVSSALGPTLVYDNISYDHPGADQLAESSIGTRPTTNFFGLPGCQSVPLDRGSSQDDPIMPGTSSGGTHAFPPTTRSGGFVDPPMAHGYRFRMTDGAKFTSILGFPTGFSAPFTVSAAGRELGAFEPGDVYDFAFGAGVDEFSVTGLNPLVDAENPKAFPIRLAFDRAMAAFEMTAIVDPEDVTAPRIECDPAPEEWRADNVSVACRASDGESGLADTADQTFALTTSIGQGVETSAAETGTRSVCDSAGNCALAGPIRGLRIDRRASTVVVTSPQAQTYSLNQSVVVSYACTDGGSGVASCAGPVPDGQALPTAVPGIHRFTLQAVDRVGNPSSTEVTYTVTSVPSFAFTGFFQPVDNLPVVNRVKAGSTVPVKFSLGGNFGLSIFSRPVAVERMTCNPSAPSDVVEEVGTDALSDLRYDGEAGQYVFGWKTSKALAGVCLRLMMRFVDGQDRTALFELR